MRVAVIGTGFSGVATACHLMQHLPTGSELVLLNASGALARGLAYGTQSEMHVLNVPAARMSLYPDSPGHFIDWARRVAPLRAHHDFLSRRLYGEYLQATLSAAIAARPEIVVRTHVTRVRRLHPVAGGLYQIESDDLLWRGQRVVLALGHFAPRPPHRALCGLAAELYVNDPWSPAALQGLAADASIMLVGTGLTMVDVLLALRKQGHRGPVLALSRRGLLPLAHRSNEIPPPAWRLSSQLTAERLTLKALVRAFRDEVKRAQALGHDWRDVLGAFRGSTAQAWSRLSEREQAQFLRHLQPYWDVHRHRAAPVAFQGLREALACGQLLVRAGRVSDVQRTAKRLSVTWRPRGTEASATFAADRVINCSGPSSDINATSSDLLWWMQEQGQLRRCPLGLGLHVDVHHQLLNAQGLPQQGLYYVGPLLKSQYWEATAVPELRVHAQQVATACLASEAE